MTEIHSPTPTPSQPAKSGSNGLAVTGFVLSLLGFLGSWIPLLNVFAIFLAVLGVIFAAIGLAKVKSSGSGKGLAITGLVLGVLAVVFAIMINATLFSAVDKAVEDTQKTTVDTGGKSKAKNSDVGKTRSNPAPLGSKITGDDWTVTINSVKTADADELGETAKSGNVLLLVNMTATYNGDDEQGSTPWATIKFITPDGDTVDPTDSFLIAPNQFDSLKTVYEGASVKGNVMLEAPANWKDGVLAVSPGMFSKDTFVAVK